VLNAIWVGLVVAAVVVAAFTGRMEAVSHDAIEATKDAIQLIIGLTGGMILFLGLVKVASEGGLLRVVVRGLRPVLERLFPGVPADHPAMHAMIMNLAANMLGLGNAATPFGLKAMVELDRLNPQRGSATNAMALFLAINATAFHLMPPTGTIMIRAAANSTAPFAIWIPTVLATLASTLTAVTVCLLLQGLPAFRPRPPADVEPAPPPLELPEAKLPGVDTRAAASPARRAFVALVMVALCAGLARQWSEQAPLVGSWPFLRDTVLVHWLLPLLLLGFVVIGILGRVRVDMLVRALDPFTSAVGFPAEALPMALLRPLSGSGAFAVMAEAVQSYGPDTFVGRLICTLQGSTETTFYVLAVYLGVVGVRDSRHILWACLAGDLAGYAAATAACHAFFG